MTVKFHGIEDSLFLGEKSFWNKLEKHFDDQR